MCLLKFISASTHQLSSKPGYGRASYLALYSTGEVQFCLGLLAGWDPVERLARQGASKGPRLPPHAGEQMVRTTTRGHYPHYLSTAQPLKHRSKLLRSLSSLVCCGRQSWKHINPQRMPNRVWGNGEVEDACFANKVGSEPGRACLPGVASGMDPGVHQPKQVSSRFSESLSQ